MKTILKSARETKTCAAKLAKDILRRPLRNRHYATVVGLVGDLGAGKTTFVQGFGEAFHIKERMVSPTFIIFRSYKLNVSPKGGSSSGGKSLKLNHLYHIDLYRIHALPELGPIGFKKLLHNPANILLIEWAEKVKRLLPNNTTWIHLAHGAKETERSIVMQGRK